MRAPSLIRAVTMATASVSSTGNVQSKGSRHMATDQLDGRGFSNYGSRAPSQKIACENKYCFREAALEF